MNKLKAFISNMLYSLASNALNLIVTTATSLLIPILLGAEIEQYGYYQIYVFYTAYIGFFHFGLCDGILLKEGGKEYNQLDKHVYSFQFYGLAILEVIICCTIVTIFSVQYVDENSLFIAFAFGINLIIYLPRNFLAYIMQSTNRIKESSLITIIGRSVYLSILLLLFILKVRDYKFFIAADILGKIIALIYVVIKCRDIVICKPVQFMLGLKYLFENISIGIKLMLASISSMVITGIVQFAIQNCWSVETYGKISLTLSMTNIVLTFICAVAIVLYPTLRRVTCETSQVLYKHIKSLLMVVLFSSLLFCYPLKLVLMHLLPQYLDGLGYLPILFPVCIFSAKVALLVQTYMQVYRMERQILQINIVGIITTLICTSISVFVFKNLTMSVMTILVSQAIRSFYAEYVLSKRIVINLRLDCIWEILLVGVFVGISYYHGPMQGQLLYFLIFCLYIFLHKNNIIESINYIKTLS